MAKLTKEELISYYEKRLEKVKVLWNPDSHNSQIEKDRCMGYIECAEEQLQEVKNGRGW